MPISFWGYIGWMALVALIGISLAIWGIKRGQFKDIEEPKYKMLEDKEPEDWPGRGKNREKPGREFSRPGDKGDRQ